MEAPSVGGRGGPAEASPSRHCPRRRLEETDDDDDDDDEAVGDLPRAEDGAGLDVDDERVLLALLALRLRGAESDAADGGMAGHLLGRGPTERV